MDTTGIEKVLITQIEENVTPSVQYILFNKDSVIQKFYYGFADIKNQIKADENTTYKAFSITKTFSCIVKFAGLPSTLTEIASASLAAGQCSWLASSK